MVDLSALLDPSLMSYSLSWHHGEAFPSFFTFWKRIGFARRQQWELPFLLQWMQALTTPLCRFVVTSAESPGPATSIEVKAHGRRIISALLQNTQGISFDSGLGFPYVYFRVIHDDLLSVFPERFEQRRSASGKLGRSSTMKILVALRWLGSGRSYDDLDDSCRMGAETIRKIWRRFRVRLLYSFMEITS